MLFVVCITSALVALLLCAGKTGLVQLTKSKDAVIIKFLIHLDTRNPPCFGYFITISPYFYLHTPYGMLNFAYNLSPF